MNKGFKIEVKRFFDAAHQLPDSEDLITKKCANLHGHTYHVKVSISGPNDRAGMVLDFSGVKQIIDILDHRYINDVFKEDVDWANVPSTAENIAQYIYERIKLQYDDLVVEEVAVCEGYKGPESSNYVVYYGA